MLESAPIALGIILVVFAYPFGIIMDRISDSMLGFFEKSIRNKYLKARLKEREMEVVKASYLRLKILMEGGEVAEFINYQRHRIRVVRSTAFNLAIISVGVVLYIAKTIEINTGLWILGTLITGIITTGGALYAWYRISAAYYKRLADSKILYDNK